MKEVNPEEVVYDLEAISEMFGEWITYVPEYFATKHGLADDLTYIENIIKKYKDLC